MPDNRREAFALSAFFHFASYESMPQVVKVQVR